MTRNQQQRQPMVSLNPDEILALLRTAKQHGIREWAMFLLGFRHAARASELANLRVDDIDMKNGSIKVARLKGSLTTVQALVDHRGQPLLSEIKALRQWLRERRDDGSDVLFPSNKGGKLSRVQIYRLFKRIALAAGLPEYKAHPHTLKHSLCSSLVAANVNLLVIKQQAGHRSVQSTLHYARISDQQASAETARALMKLF